MRVEIRKELNLNKPVNLHRLPPTLKIYAGIMAKWRESKTYKTKLEKSLEAEYTAKMQHEEKIKELLLGLIYRELVTNASLADKDAKCSEIVISVDQNYEEALHNVITNKDFLPYEISFVEENSDLRKAFHDMPVLIRVKKKAL